MSTVPPQPWLMQLSYSHSSFLAGEEVARKPSYAARSSPVTSRQPYLSFGRSSMKLTSGTMRSIAPSTLLLRASSTPVVTRVRKAGSADLAFCARFVMADQVEEMGG